MSKNPYSADLSEKARLDSLDERVGAALRDDLRSALRLSPDRFADNLGGVLRADFAAGLVDRHGLASVDDLMLLGLGVAQDIARPPISGFHVGAIGLEAETGNLVFGGNVEFPGTHLAYTLHGEGFVFTRAFSRGTSIRRIALGEAHPCAHCRQYLSEFALGPDLELIDPLGHRLTLGALYPWPFDSRYLGQPGALPGADNFPALAAVTDKTPSKVIDALFAAGRRAHAPYSACPGAVALLMADGRIVTGASVESVAFNPTMSPMQAAVVDLIAHGYDFGDIAGVALGTVVGGAVDYTASTRELLGSIAPGITLDIIDWRPR